jgi:hypothetical protein
MKKKENQVSADEQLTVSFIEIKQSEHPIAKSQIST